MQKSLLGKTLVPTLLKLNHINILIVGKYHRSTLVELCFKSPKENFDLVLMRWVGVLAFTA